MRGFRGARQLPGGRPPRRRHHRHRDCSPDHCAGRAAATGWRRRLELRVGRWLDSLIVHSTLSSLKGLLYYEAATGGRDVLRAARRIGEEYLLERRLLRTLSRSDLVGPWVTRFAYPFRCFYSVLNAAEYCRAGLVRGRRVARRAVQVPHVLRQRVTCVVGWGDPRLNACSSLSTPVGCRTRCTVTGWCGCTGGRRWSKSSAEQRGRRGGALLVRRLV